MKIRNIIITALSVTLVISLILFVQPVQTLAMNFLSNFRVQDIHAINISLDDIQQIAQALEAVMPSDKNDGEGSDSQYDAPGAMDSHDSQLVTIGSTRAFRAFDFKLPQALNSQTPALKMAEPQAKTVTVDTREINEKLMKFGAQPLPGMVDGSQITLQTPSVAIAEYSDIILLETQMPVFSGDNDAVSELKQCLLSLPGLTENLRSQLADVDLATGTVYVPVIEGFGQQTAVGNSTGYIYSVSDLQTLIGSLPEGLIPSEGADTANKLQDHGEGSALIWANGGVLYVLVGNQDANALVQIAKSIN